MKNVFLKKGSVVWQDTDAIVNAANDTLRGGGGVDGAIHRAAGPGLLAECITLNGCKTGQAKITKGYNLKAKYVIHTVGPIYNGTEKDAKDLYDCYYNSLSLALDNGLKSISFCCISVGVYGYPLLSASKIALKAIGDFQEAHPDAIKVYICCFKDIEYETYKSLLG